MRNMFCGFAASEDGAVTVDWVLLTTAAVALAMASYSTISSATNTAASDSGTAMENLTRDWSPSSGN